MFTVFFLHNLRTSDARPTKTYLYKVQNQIDFEIMKFSLNIIAKNLRETSIEINSTRLYCCVLSV